jgi:hypothetical protein
MLFLLMTSFFILSDSKTALMVGLITFLAHRLLVIFFIIKWSTITNFVPILISSISFIFTSMLTLADGI